MIIQQLITQQLITQQILSQQLQPHPVKNLEMFFQNILNQQFPSIGNNILTVENIEMRLYRLKDKGFKKFINTFNY